uniref:B30.2/SPRY domain-containing protein n=1 Tax=Globodera rostochiensis TaxID=31243 RepID=A0A914HP33_GLORO
MANLQIQRRRRLPLELQCEVISALPFQHGRRMLLLCNSIAKNCIALIRKQKEKFENRWDPTACHYKLALIGPEQLIVQHNGARAGSVLAENPMSKNPYFEVESLEQTWTKGFIWIGLATKQMPLNNPVGLDEGTYGYASVGFLCGHEVEESFYGVDGRTYSRGMPSFGCSDVVGCGVNLKNGQIIYTKNGERLDTANLFVDSAAELFPCISLFGHGTKIEANFGPNFKYKF